MSKRIDPEERRIQEWQARRGIHQFAKNLRKNLPKSEKWFLDLYKKEYLDYQLQSNIVIGYYIADFVYKNIVIEIDDPTHLKPEQQLKDAKKDLFYMRRGYSVIRIQAWNMESYRKGIRRLEELALESRKIEYSKYNNYKFKKFTKPKYVSKAKRCDGCHRRPKVHRVFWKGKKFHLCAHCYEKNKKLYK